MNREILFRGKRIDNGEWIEGGFCKHQNRTLCAIGDSLKPEDIDYLILKSGFSDWNMPKPLEAYAVTPSTVGQFTGLTDKNGKRIFEGDIVKVFDSVINEFVNVECFYWNEFCQFTFKNTNEDLSFLNNESIEIIGTIHDKTEQP